MEHVGETSEAGEQRLVLGPLPRQLDVLGERGDLTHTNSDTTTTKTRFEPTRIAPETFLIHDHHGEGEAPVSVALNAMVIRGAEPVVVDTGMMENRDQYLADVFSLVEPDDIRSAPGCRWSTPPSSSAPSTASRHFSQRSSPAATRRW